VSRTVHASTDSIWRVLGDFGTEDRWTRTVHHCARVTARSWQARILIWPLAKPMLQRLTRSVIGELDTYLATRSAR